MDQDSWRPTLIIGLTRGGLLPATIISHWYNIPMLAVNISLRDFSEINDANLEQVKKVFEYGKQILIVDDINDSGNTLFTLTERIHEFNIQNMILYRTATVFNKPNSKFNVDYYGHEIPEHEYDDWIIFPYEES
jgi:hypoxanthine phosphoribosyltransferase